MSEKSNNQTNRKAIKTLTSGAKQVLKEPILKMLQEGSTLSLPQLETLLIDLVVEDNLGTHITYEDKASYRSRTGSRSRGVSRGAFNRTLTQARRNVTRCLYTMLLLAYLGLFDSTVFRPFEVVATRIGDYRRIRDILAGKTELTQEDLESIAVTEKTIVSFLDDLSSALALKSELSKKRPNEE
ncbi:MAG: hypothetical protein RTV31_15750 [Candidatus Thorarchaeota archaeon]